MTEDRTWWQKLWAVPELPAEPPPPPPRTIYEATARALGYDPLDRS
jgi:hypothetical protein